MAVSSHAAALFGTLTDISRLHSVQTYALYTLGADWQPKILNSGWTCAKPTFWSLLQTEGANNGGRGSCPLILAETLRKRRAEEGSTGMYNKMAAFAARGASMQGRG